MEIVALILVMVFLGIMLTHTIVRLVETHNTLIHTEEVLEELNQQLSEAVTHLNYRASIINTLITTLQGLGYETFMEWVEAEDETQEQPEDPH